jgi:predicted dehydrogenase
MKELTIGVIGGGSFFEAVHAQAINLMPGIKRKILHRRNEEKARTTCEKWGYDTYYLDFDEMCEKEDLDALYVITPPAVTRDLAVRAIERGIPSFLEKPLAQDFQGLKEIGDAYEKHKTPHFVAYNRRHISILKEARAYVEKKGGLTHLALDFFRHDRRAPTQLMGQGVHGIDTIRFLCGDVEWVHTIRSPVQYFDRKPVAFSALLKFKSGVTGVFNYNCRAGKCSERYSLFTENGTVCVELSNPGGIEYPKRLTIYEGEQRVKEVDFIRDLPREELTASHFNGIVDEHAYFLDHLRNNKPMVVDVYESIKTTRLAEAIQNVYCGELRDFPTPPITIE